MLKNDKCLRISALFHDIGKPLVYKEDDDGIGHFYNHWNVSIDIFKKYENKFNLSMNEISLIKTLIFYHNVILDRTTIEEKYQMIDEIGITNISLLFELKKV